MFRHSVKQYSGVFIAEGTSDAPLADIVERLFLERHEVSVRLSQPDFANLKIAKDVRTRVEAAVTLAGSDVDLVVVHRDADSAGWRTRRDEIVAAHLSAATSSRLVPIIPVRMTEAWLLLDEDAIRRVAGNPNGKSNLDLPSVKAAESVADPKELLQKCILAAADETGRRRDRVRKRFSQNRRQLLELLDTSGPVSSLASWQELESSIADVARVLAG